jgi:hypothetical protein
MLATLAPVLSGVGVAPVTSSYFSIATQTVGSGGASSITFSSIPSTYTHLQVRGIGRENTGGGTGGGPCTINFNGDSGSNYTWHIMEGNGSSVAGYNATSATYGRIGLNPGSSSTANFFGPIIVDVLDYTNSNKYKTVRSLNGFDLNGSGGADFTSSLWMNTNAITSITIGDSYGFAQYSSYALYGVK